MVLVLKLLLTIIDLSVISNVGIMKLVINIHNKITIFIVVKSHLMYVNTFNCTFNESTSV